MKEWCLCVLLGTHDVDIYSLKWSAQVSGERVIYSIQRVPFTAHRSLFFDMMPSADRMLWRFMVSPPRFGYIVCSIPITREVLVAPNPLNSHTCTRQASSTTPSQTYPLTQLETEQNKKVKYYPISSKQIKAFALNYEN